MVPEAHGSPSWQSWFYSSSIPTTRTCSAWTWVWWQRLFEVLERRETRRAANMPSYFKGVHAIRKCTWSFTSDKFHGNIWVDSCTDLYHQHLSTFLVTRPSLPKDVYRVCYNCNIIFQYWVLKHKTHIWKNYEQTVWSLTKKCLGFFSARPLVAPPAFRAGSPPPAAGPGSPPVPPSVTPAGPQVPPGSPMPLGVLGVMGKYGKMGWFLGKRYVYFSWMLWELLTKFVCCVFLLLSLFLPCV